LPGSDQSALAIQASRLRVETRVKALKPSADLAFQAFLHVYDQLLDAAHE
jgi:hypothetical protein